MNSNSLNIINNTDSLALDTNDIDQARLQLVVEQSKLTRVKRLKLEGQLVDKDEIKKEWVRGLKSIRRQICVKCGKIIDNILQEDI